MSSETITRNDLTNILNEVLPPIGSAVLYNGAKVSSGSLTLSDAYINYDFLHISYVVNSDRFTKVFDCNALTANPTSTWSGDVSIYGTNSVTYMSDCYFTVTDSTHLSVGNTGNNANFIAGIYKIVGITSHDTKSGIAMDYIVEQGTNGDWTYRKWNSGIAECWGTVSVNVTSYIAWGNQYYSSPYCTATFPTDLFVSIPVVTAIRTGGAEGTTVVGGVSKTGITTMYILRPIVPPNGTLYFSVCANGNWK